MAGRPRGAGSIATCKRRYESKHIAAKKWTFKPLAESRYAVEAFGTCSQADKWPYGLSGQFPDYVGRNWPGGLEGIDKMRDAFLRKVRGTGYGGGIGVRGWGRGEGLLTLAFTLTLIVAVTPAPSSSPKSYPTTTLCST